MKPPFAYYGGKTTLAQWIVDHLPPHRHYVEPFAGSLAVLLAKPPAPFETVNDLDGDLMTFWRVLRDEPELLIRACAMTPHSRAEHRAAFDLAGAPDDVERARRVWVLLTQGRGRSFLLTGWRTFEAVGAAGGRSLPLQLVSYVDRMRDVAERIRTVSLECRPALELIAAYGKHAETCLYVDPPYLGSTRGSLDYVHELATDAEHVELIEALRRCRASVVLSGYPSPLYDDLLGDWHQLERAARTSQGNHSDADQARTEVLWSNRPLTHDLFTAAGEAV